MFGLSNSLLAYLAAGAIAAAGAGYAGYQAWKANQPRPPIEQPATPPTAQSPAVTTAPASTPDEPKQIAAVPPPPAPIPPPQPPEFDVVRVEPSGDAVVAGRAAPNSKVVLLNKGQEIARGDADANGQFVILPPPLPPGDHLLALGAENASTKTTSVQTVAVAVPEKKDQTPLVALSAPNQPTRVLSTPAAPTQPVQTATVSTTQPPTSQSATPARAAPSDVSIRTVEADDSGGFYASGAATAGGNVQLYLNDAPVANVIAGPDRQWSLKIERGMTGGAYRVRADLLGPDGSVVARVEVPFDYPARRVASLPQVAPQPPLRPADLPAQSPASAQTPAPQAAVAEPAAPTPQQASPANAVVPEVQSVTVTRGDNLWRISRKVLGQGMRYTQIYEANTAQIRNPRLIFPNQILVVPKPPAN